MPEPLKLLLITDNPDDAHLLAMELGSDTAASYQLDCVGSLTDGLGRLAVGGIDAVLLDPVLPDSTPDQTIAAVPSLAMYAPVLVVTGLDDESLAMRAVQAGAQDYLARDGPKGLIRRALRYAIERHRLLAALEQSRQHDEREREMRSLDSVSGDMHTTVTATLFGKAPLREAAPATFAELASRYDHLLSQALDQRIYRVDYHVSDGLRALGEHLGFLRAGPRDVIDLHSTALRRRLKSLPLRQSQALVEEARLMVLELMGNLAAYYRTYSIGTRHAMRDLPGHSSPTGDAA